MISVKRIITKTNYSTQYVVIDIELNDTSEDLSKYEINVLKSVVGHDNGRYKYIAKDIQELTIRDFSSSTLPTDAEFNYVVEIVNKETKETYKSDVAVLTDMPGDMYSEYITSMYDLYLDRVIGDNEDYNKMALFTRIRSGQRCPKCYDPVRGRSQNQNCPVCIGTGYKGGYYSPVKIQVNFINPDQISESFAPSGVGKDSNMISVWTKNYPVIHPRDILVDRNNRRYTVEGVQESRKGWHIIRQSLTMHELPKNNPVYKLEVGDNLYEY